jgi:hypothetical protein
LPDTPDLLIDRLDLALDLPEPFLGQVHPLLVAKLRAGQRSIQLLTSQPEMNRGLVQVVH